MQNVINISKDISVIFTRGDYGYAEVMDRFPEARVILIVTYNISQEGDILLNRLKAANPKSVIRVITNVPSRWNDYWGAQPKLKARETILRYVAKLEPRLFPANTKTYFCYNNHVKIVATESICYVGSSNFSDESGDKFECGVIFRDPKVVYPLLEMVFPEISKVSDQHTSNDLARGIILLNSAIANLLEILPPVVSDFYTETDTCNARPSTYFAWESVEVTPVALAALADLLEAAEDSLEDISKVEAAKDLLAAFDCGELRELRSLLDPKAPIGRFVEAGGADEPYSKIAEQAEHDVAKLVPLTERLQKRIDALATDLRKLSLPAGPVDNTAPPGLDLLN